MVDARWELLTTTPNTATARALAESLEADGVACQVRTESTLLGECQPCRLLVDPAQAKKARLLLAQSHFTDQELAFLATGTVMCDAAKE